MNTTEIDLTIKDLADRTGLTPRMLNIYRASAEKRLGTKLGTKIGKTPRFKPDEVREILKERESASFGETGNSRNFREVTNFSQADNQAEGEILSGMDAIVASGDQNAISIGQALGLRWNGLMWSAALQSMQGGMIAMQQKFDELHSSVTVGLQSADFPQMDGQGLSTPTLPVHFESDED